MTDKEYELTVFLFQNPGGFCRAGTFGIGLERSADVQSRTVDTHVSRVRKKLDFGTAMACVLSPVYNFGYRLEKISPE